MAVTDWMAEQAQIGYLEVVAMTNCLADQDERI